MFGEHSVYVIAAYSLFVVLVLWNLISPLYQLRSWQRRLRRTLLRSQSKGSSQS